MPIKEMGFNADLGQIASTKQHADFNVNFSGLTIRAELAARAMQGILANRWTMEHRRHSAKEVAELSTEYADALINALNEEK